jgi:molybdopterin synthase sulfur carrier subunit
MKISLLYFGRPRELLALSNETADVPDNITTLGALLAWLRLRGEIWNKELADNRVRCAINQEFSGLDDSIHEQDEIAIFSPISGG